MEQEDVYGRRGSSWQRATGRARRRRRGRKNLSARLGGWTRAVIAFLFSNVGIVCLVIGYTIAGAFLFTRIEGRYSKDIAGDVKKLRNLTVTTLWKLSAKENYAEKLWMAKVRTILENYQNKMVTAIRNGYDGMEESKKWSFAGAFLYSLTVITTIGYGNICPKTKWGKIVTIVYAIIGMPLFLLYLSNIGDILAKSFKWTYARCCLCKCRTRVVYIDRGSNPIANKGKNYWQGKEHLVINRSQWNEQFGRSRNTDERKYTSDFNFDRQADRYGVARKSGYEIEGEELEEEEEEEEEQSEDSVSYDPQRVTVPLTLCLGIMVGYIWGGAILFSEWEDWNILDGSYFCFVSLSTIGFGDIVPGDKIYSGQGFELSFIFCSMYLMLGMALIAMCFNLMQEEVIAKMRALLRIIKYIFRCDR